MNALEACLRHGAAHSSRTAALAALANLRRAGKPTAGLQPYRCPVCRSWHLGHGKRSR